MVVKLLIMINRKAKRIIVIFLISVIAVYLLILIVGAGIALYDAAHLEEKMNNKYIDSGFDGWKKIEVDYGYEFMIPDEWKIFKNSHNHFIEYGGKVIAYVKVVETSEYETETFFEQLLNTEIKEFSEQPIDRFTRIDGSSFCKYIVNGENSYYHLKISRSKHYVNILFTNVSESEEEFTDFAQAIAYSALVNQGQSETIRGRFYDRRLIAFVLSYSW